ncbi:MAG: hypothetical protein V4492_09070 [Chlamydiota bacterium]
MKQYPPFALVKAPAPVFNTAELGRWFGGEERNSLLLDDEQLLRCTETVLLPGSKVKILEPCTSGSAPLWKISTREYPFGEEFYVHEHFLDFQEEEPKERARLLPSREEILSRCEGLLGTRYIWGGSWPEGIPSLVKLHPPRDSFELLSRSLQEMWTLKGVDCSGLLYYATNGFTPHRTSALFHFGKEVPLAGKGAEAIAAALEPLDLIVWQGHVLIAIEGNRLIESRNPAGVVATDSVARIAEILKMRNPIDFALRRWHQRDESLLDYPPCI